jgi:hypothetical protein
MVKSQIPKMNWVILNTGSVIACTNYLYRIAYLSIAVFSLVNILTSTFQDAVLKS